jgi:hypothetical protein
MRYDACIGPAPLNRHGQLAYLYSGEGKANVKGVKVVAGHGVPMAIRLAV